LGLPCSSVLPITKAVRYIKPHLSALPPFQQYHPLSLLPSFLFRLEGAADLIPVP
jgi:hypothetical protein